jgi:hypothetical protein
MLNIHYRRTYYVGARHEIFKKEMNKLIHLRV